MLTEAGSTALKLRNIHLAAKSATCLQGVALGLMIGILKPIFSFFVPSTEERGTIIALTSVDIQKSTWANHFIAPNSPRIFASEWEQLLSETTPAWFHSTLNCTPM